ncbi:hypothetical protein SAMN05421640_2937 [Ekhidna lutea]|uniref:Uncharacterized protein n=1 Tax=Ekhidna lutea TaxID=447679 RepID=A0A239L461_EKHLU|nr:hypothetical protein [Ekhidna lutea]SNT24782.1 hypothetical protein SAMN05421640_2937 [Ekhidna lutea]
MDAQQVLNKFLVQIILQDALKDREETKIFIPTSFARELERNLKLKTYKDLGYGGYRVICGPFHNISAYNKIKNVQMVINTRGEVVESEANKMF